MTGLALFLAGIVLGALSTVVLLALAIQTTSDDGDAPEVVRDVE